MNSYYFIFDKHTTDTCKNNKNRHPANAIQH